MNQDRDVTVNPYSLASYFVEVLRDKIKLATVTCFSRYIRDNYIW